MDSNLETFYELLQLNSNASVTEVIQAYQQARAAYSKHSMATYSLLSTEETHVILARLEEAYLTLSSPERRRDYDDRLLKQEKGPEMTSHTPVATQTPHHPMATPTVNSDAATHLAPDTAAAHNLKLIREKRGLTLDEVGRITKIPVKFISAIEEMNVKKLPARVYIQGFIKNLATLYRVDPKAVVTDFLARLDEINPPV